MTSLHLFYLSILIFPTFLFVMTDTYPSLRPQFLLRIPNSDSSILLVTQKLVPYIGPSVSSSTISPSPYNVKPVPYLNLQLPRRSITQNVHRQHSRPNSRPVSTSKTFDVIPLPTLMIPSLFFVVVASLSLSFPSNFSLFPYSRVSSVLSQFSSWGHLPTRKLSLHPYTEDFLLFLLPIQLLGLL